MVTLPDVAPEQGEAVDAVDGSAARPGFEVHLDNFTGPFDLLLSLIAKHELDVTEVALAAADVRDELVGDPPEGDLGDVELVLRDEREQEVERAREVLEVHLEGRVAVPVGRRGREWRLRSVLRVGRR